MTKEAVFKKRLMRKLKRIPKSLFFSKEAVSVRGIPDIVGLVDGKFVAIECKRNMHEVMKNGGHIELQKYFVKKVNELGGFARFVCPENEEEILEELLVFVRPATLRI